MYVESSVDHYVSENKLHSYIHDPEQIIILR